MKAITNFINDSFLNQYEKVVEPYNLRGNNDGMFLN
ncbi:hypothetical protein SAMN05421852_10587 [Thermoflavimicrobium dichotomicum]|uniref:Uncharacterized protein n=1 Tax=Thermoflavimicrobium dichotomicum TaxID=46223 RepID=A0A1I3P4G3_9BACL|nr:hypothetical protein SAMN05421852_10587 [Thermoflavimicrobium dichotomicum]